MDMDQEICDVLVIGSGMAGLRAAIEARRAGLRTLVVDKSILARASASIYAGALVARKPPEYLVKMGVIEPGMDFEQPFDVSFRYFVREGARTGGSWFTANQRLSMTVACEMDLRAYELRDFGVEDIFSQRWLGPPGVYGKNIMLPALEYAKRTGVKTREMTMITDLIRQEDSVVGAFGFDIRKGCFVEFQAKAVVLATGSHGQIYERTYAPVRMTGDGYAMSYRAGALLSDMEMMGFDNWGIAEPGLPQYWIPGSSARVKGVLRNALGEPFFLKYAKEHGILGEGATLSLSDDMSKRYGRPFIELVPHLVKASMKEILEGKGDKGAVFLDLTRVPEEMWYVDAKGIFTLNLLRGFDLKKRQLRVAPICIGDFKGGGVRIDEKARTDLEGLFAAGDVSPGSSLLYALVTGVLAGRSAVNRARDASLPELVTETREWLEEKRGELDTILKRKSSERGEPGKIKSAVKQVMWVSGGPLREERGLQQGAESLKELEKEALPVVYADGSFRKLREAVEASNMVQVGKMILASSLYRTESRGYNQRLDFPERDDKNWLKNTVIRRTDDGINIGAIPVELVFMSPEGGEKAK
ncbi:MAG: FAD-binding protein [Deltaproteobacteria bacterium]|nr:FAD-binding protein [Deltaproteobacteria bacterium]